MDGGLPVFTIKAPYKFFPCTPTEELGIRNYLGISPKNFRERTFLLLLTREHPRKDTSWIGLKVLDILLCLGKLRFINIVIIVFKHSQNGELNYIILRWRFWIFLFCFFPPLSSWYVRFSLKQLCFKDFLYSVLDLSNTSFDDEFSDNSF